MLYYEQTENILHTNRFEGRITFDFHHNFSKITFFDVRFKKKLNFSSSYLTHYFSYERTISPCCMMLFSFLVDDSRTHTTFRLIYSTQRCVLL
jgi:hypothetical protein